MTVNEIKSFLETADMDDFVEIDKAVREIKTERKEEFKETKEARKSEIETVKRAEVEKLEKGDNIVIIFKGEKTEVVFEKLTEKRFTVIIDGNKRSIMFDKFVGLAE